MAGLRSIAALACVAAAPLAAQSSVWIVDDTTGPDVDFTSIPDAVAAVSAGDTLLVRPGSYGSPTEATPISITKGLTIVAAEGPGTVTIGATKVSGLPFGERLVVRGVAFETAATGANALTVGLGESDVWLEDCVISAMEQGHIGLALESGTAVLRRCKLLGGESPPGNAYALYVGVAAAYLYDCEVQGAAGSEGAHGGYGAEVWGFLFASGTSFRGGQGGASVLDPDLGCKPGGLGGDGLHAWGEVHALRCSFAGGFGGEQGCGAAGFPGYSVYLQPGYGELTIVPGSNPRLSSASSPVHESGAVQVDLAGAAGDLAFLAFTSQASTPAYLPELHGALLLAPPLAVVPAGVIGPDDTATVTLPVGSLPPGLESLSVHGQALFLSTSGAAYLGAGSSVLILDDAIAL